jgi:type II secretory pathway pseudopilin PulG
MKKTAVTRSQTTSQIKRGFLLVELLIGLVVVALVMFGAASIMEAVAQGWNDQDVTRSTQVQANQTYLRVHNALEGAKYVGYTTPSSSQSGSIFFWQNDNLGGVQAGDPYVGEMALIQYDPTTTTLWLYQVPSSQLGNSQAQQPLTLAEINEATEATWFTQQSFVTKQALGGPGNQPSGATSLDVSSFQVYVSSLGSATQLPVIEYSIDFTRSDGTNLSLYSSTTIHGPATQPE